MQPWQRLLEKGDKTEVKSARGSRWSKSRRDPPTSSRRRGRKWEEEEETTAGVQHMATAAGAVWRTLSETRPASAT